MFSFSDPEGEVDHSFFDSDCDTNHVSRGERVEEGLKAGEGSLSAHQRLHAQQTENVKGSWSQSRDATKTHLKLVKKNRGGREKKKESSCQSKEEELSRASSISSVSCISGRVIKNLSDGDEESDLHSERPSGAIMALLADAKEVDCEDVYRGQNPNKSKEESLLSNSKHSGSKGKNKQSSKKWIRNRRTRIPSSVSAEASIDADSESSCSISDAGSNTNSPTLPRPMKSSSPRVRRSRVGSEGSREAARHTEESDNTVTYVSPLSSPDISPLQSLDLNHTEAEEGSLKEQQQESVISSGLCHISQREDSDQDEDDECSLHSESWLQGKLTPCCPGGKNRKNYSFTNNEVQAIDLQNQRLLRKLSSLSAGPRPGSLAGKKTSVTSNSPIVRLSHSGLNRQREHQRINRENLAFLKRLESVKPTPSLKRSEQLADYQKLCSYPIAVSTKKQGRSTSKTPSVGSRPVSSAEHSLRAVSTTTVSSYTHVPQSKKLNAARPAWC